MDGVTTRGGGGGGGGGASDAGVTRAAAAAALQRRAAALQRLDRPGEAATKRKAHFAWCAHRQNLRVRSAPQKCVATPMAPRVCRQNTARTQATQAPIVDGPINHTKIRSATHTKPASVERAQRRKGVVWPLSHSSVAPCSLRRQNERRASRHALSIDAFTSSSSARAAAASRARVCNGRSRNRCAQQ